MNNSYNFNNKYPCETNDCTIVNFDTLQKARQDLIGEIQAVIEYDNHIRSTNVKLAKETWENIKNEELVHVGELLGLINYLDPCQRRYVLK